MVNLGDYLGSIAAELTRSRLEADLEAVRVAELYDNHELLKHFPVPRMRFKEVDFDIPMTVIKSGDPSSREPVTKANVLKQFKAVLTDQLKAARIELSRRQVTALNRLLREETDSIEMPLEVAVGTNHIADRLTWTVRDYLKKVPASREKVDTVVDPLRRSARLSLLDAVTRGSRLEVGVTTAEIRESPADALMTVRLSISEEGIEWTNVSDEPGGDMRLVPE